MLGIRHYKGKAIDLYLGDITEFACDGIVNAANETLAGGGGVDGAIHKAGGPSILAECKAIGTCPTGTAVTTNAGNLPAKKVIHTVGPVWHGGNQGEEKLLASAYKSSLEQADRHGLKHISFPSISTGIFSYPVAKAAAVSFQAIREYIDEHPESNIRRITLVLFSKDDHSLYQSKLFDQFPEE